MSEHPLQRVADALADYRESHPRPDAAPQERTAVMSQTPACPDVPDDVRDLARSIATKQADRQFSLTWYALRRAATAAILADRASRALPSTALAARPEEGCQIKPLEWDEPERGFTMRRAITPLGIYSTWTHFEAEGAWFWSLRPRTQFAVVDEGAGRSEAEVQGKAQAHYEARIRSAFVAPSTPLPQETAMTDLVERIEKAAIWHRGRVYTVPAPGRHHDVIRLMSEKYGLGPEAQKHQGFSTNAERYVDRKDGWKIAVAAGQLLPRAPTDGHGGTLYSEDVW